MDATSPGRAVVLWDQCRCRVQQELHGHHGRAQDPPVPGSASLLRACRKPQRLR